jgi:hypothetical protein
MKLTVAVVDGDESVRDTTGYGVRERAETVCTRCVS